MFDPASSSLVIIVIDFVLFQQPEIMNCSEGDVLVYCSKGTAVQSLVVRLPVVVRGLLFGLLIVVCLFVGVRT